MGIMDKVKSQAGQLADKAQQVGQTGQAKIAELQGKRKADALLLELGGLIYSEQVGRAVPNGEARAEQIMADLKTYEAEHGPVKVTGADSADS
jgi:hypothetical protein